MVHEYIGSKITIISRNDKRYEGVLHSIDVDKSTITLKDVRYFENNPNGKPGPASSTVFEMIVFRGSDITDLAVCQPVVNNTNIPQDPAIVSISEGNKSLSNSNSSNQQGSKVNNLKNSSKINYIGNKSLNNTNNTMHQNNNKEHMRNRQRNSSNRNYKGNNHSHFNNHYQRSFVVGELKPRINQALKAELESEFDFSEQNKKFEKSFNNDLAHSQNNQSLRTSISETIGIGNSSENLDEQARNLTVGGYDKVSGFFDSISCETLDPERSKKPQSPSDPQMKALREKQKMIDKETFGTSALKTRSGTYNRGSHRRNHNNNRGNNNRYNKRES